MKLKKIAMGLSALMLSVWASAQPPMLIHSHNDYCRRMPFYQAYAQGVHSIEADVFLHKGKLLVGHDIEDLRDEMTFEQMYVRPLVTLFGRNGGKAWADSDENLQLLVELKSETEPTLKAVVKMLRKYPSVFDPSVNRHAVRIAITGNVPSPEEFSEYPEWIAFDGQWDEDYTPEQLERIALVSANFRNFSKWKGKGSIVESEAAKLQEVIDRVHAWNKPVRFWGAPEGITVYYTFWNMGIDYMNTDRPEQCAEFYNDFGNKNFQIGAKTPFESGRVTRTKRLDKATRNFSGFQSEKMHLSKGIEVYQPSFLNDGALSRVRNVILLIGDGMGLEQIMAGLYANHGLSLATLKHIGFQRTHALNAFTTDSAAAGSALATGESHNNRHVSATGDNVPVPSLSDFFVGKGCPVGVVTLGDVSDATPAAFYGHSTERDNSDILTAYLTDGCIDLLCGSGIAKFTKREDGRNLAEELEAKYSFVRSVDAINAREGKVICIDEQMGEAASEENLPLLAQATREAIRKLQARSDNGFFLMVEGAKIDYAGHARCLPGSVIETLSFDLAVAEALKFADSNGETLVIVTADHETGGLMLLDGDEKTGRVMGVYVTDDHTPALIPVFAYGPGAREFMGCYRNTEIPHRIKALTEENDR